MSEDTNKNKRISEAMQKHAEDIPFENVDDSSVDNKNEPVNIQQDFPEQSENPFKKQLDDSQDWENFDDFNASEDAHEDSFEKPKPRNENFQQRLENLRDVHPGTIKKWARYTLFAGLAGFGIAYAVFGDKWEKNREAKTRKILDEKMLKHQQNLQNEKEVKEFNKETKEIIQDWDDFSKMTPEQKDSVRNAILNGESSSMNSNIEGEFMTNKNEVMASSFDVIAKDNDNKLEAVEVGNTAVIRPVASSKFKA